MTDATRTAPPRDSAPLPDRVTMPLLTLVTLDAVDQDYVHAAQRRAAAGGTPPPGTSRTRMRGAVVVTVAFGLLIALAAVQTARNSDVHQASRDALIERIDARRHDLHTMQVHINALQQQTDELRSEGVRAGTQLLDANAELRRLEVGTGFVAVHGPGLRITVDDDPDGSADGRVRASDLRLLVNGLWQAGAEAIAINGRRLSTISAIVNSNISIQVNRSPLTPPYVVSAIGGPTMAARLKATASDQQFAALADDFGFVVDRQNANELVLPSAPDSQLRLRYAVRGSTGPDNQEDAP